MSYPENMKLRARELKPGRSASQVCRLLESEFPGEPVYPDPRQIYRWCNPKASVRHSVSQLDGHNERLTAVAKILLDNDLEKVTEEGEVYQIFRKGYEFEEITRNQLAGRLMGNLDIAVQEYGEWFVLDCFFPHMDTENEELVSDLFGLMENRPFEMIKLLRLAYHRNKFKGTCPVCEEWQ